MKKQSFLQCPRIDLILVEPDDAPTIASWFNDAEVTVYLARGARPMTLASERDYLEKMYTDNAHLMFGLWHKADKKLVGVIGLHHIDHINQIAELGICIGDKAYWSNGIGTEAITALLGHAFGRLNLRSVRLIVIGNNPRGQRCYEKCGFTEIGRYPKHLIKDGVWYDEILMLANNPMYA